MNTPKLIVMCGLPRAGKSTWIELNKVDEIVVSNDWIRENIFQNHYSRSINPSIWMITDSVLRILLGQGKSVILDGVNLTKRTRKEFLDTAKECGAKTEIVFLTTDIRECIERNTTDHKLPHDKLTTMCLSLEMPSEDEADILTIVKDSKAPPDNYWHYHHIGCGTMYRGCHPTACPKNQYEETGIWKRKWE